MNTGYCRANNAMITCTESGNAMSNKLSFVSKNSRSFVVDDFCLLPLRRVIAGFDDAAVEDCLVDSRLSRV